MSNSFGSQLMRSQKKELSTLLKEFDDMLQGKPGQTRVTEHRFVPISQQSPFSNFGSNVGTVSQTTAIPI